MSWKDKFPSDNRAYEDDAGILFLGDVLEVLKTFPDNCIDTVITDPPYGLSDHSEKTIREVLSKWLNGEDDYIPKKKGFMGKTWDAFVPPPALWREVYRVMKPGATILVFAGTRTYDLMTISLRLAGFVIKDTLMWLYGSGFPKATDISKQIDKMKGAERRIIEEKVRKVNWNNTSYNVGSNNEDRRDITAPATPEAQLWDGWKSHGLKPAYEPIIMAMKPNEGSYAQNALKWGVAGLWIDGGRIGNEKIKLNGGGKKWRKNGREIEYVRPINEIREGRFPANILLDEDSAKMLDEQSGILKSGGVGRGKDSKGNFYGGGWHNPNNYNGGDSGGASRFFYVAKASKKERNMGLEKETEPSLRPSGVAFNEHSGVHRKKRKGNFHPTVKPLKLMEYLCKLTKTPSGGIVLDPFAGSGTTGMACVRTGRPYVLIEIDPEYVEIAKRRIKAVSGGLFNAP